MSGVEAGIWGEGIWLNGNYVKPSEYRTCLRCGIPRQVRRNAADICALIGKWQADADLCDEAGIETPTMPIRSAIADLRGILGGES